MTSRKIDPAGAQTAAWRPAGSMILDALLLGLLSAGLAAAALLVCVGWDLVA